jgi:hypothetical protein
MIDDSENFNYEVTLNELNRFKVIISAPNPEDAAHQAYQVYQKTYEDQELFETIFYDPTFLIMPINIENDVKELEPED